jgi:hypothetical protein
VSTIDLHLYYQTIRYLRPKQILFRLYYLIRGRSRWLMGFRYPASLLCPEYSPAVSTLRLAPFIPSSIGLQDKSFTFLNHTKNFPDKIDWNYGGFGKLWQYNLNYFDYLLQPGMTRETGLAVILDFIERADGSGGGFDAYPISMRGVNWIKFLTLHGIGDGRNDAIDGGHSGSTSVDAADAAAINASLYAQYRRLLDNIEYHLMGNHLLENGFSLLFGGVYFGDACFYRKAEEILREELVEQILPDGGHFERSPMYHQIILGRVLDCINLLKSEIGGQSPYFSGTERGAGRHGKTGTESHFPAGKSVQSLVFPQGVHSPISQTCHGKPVEPCDARRPAQGDNKLQDLNPLLALLEEKAAVMLGWLRQMTFSDGSIPLVNDAAYGIAPTSGELFAYAKRLDIRQIEAPLGESGYRKIANDVYEAILDVGAIGPDYIPGHAHADTLSFELRVGGCPVIVDSGISTYGDDGRTRDDKARAQSLRQRQRGTAAHNTVEIDGQDSSEVWGSFRVARRARVTELRERAESEGSAAETRPTRGQGVFPGGGYVPPVVIAAAHDGYRRLPGKPVHRREWRFSENALRIQDTIEGDFREAVGRLHFHPDVRLAPSSCDGGAVGAASAVCDSGRIILPDGCEMRFEIKKGRGRLVDTTYHPEFNISLPNRCLEVRFDSPETVVEFVW